MCRSAGSHGRTISAGKKTASLLCQQMTQQDPDVAGFAMLLLSVGEFEDADQLISQLSESSQNDPILSALLLQQQQ
jgi:hypothetical protein